MFNSYNFPQQDNDPQNYYYYKEGFDIKELGTIYNGIQSLKANKADTVGGSSDKVRSSKIRWIPQNDDWYWLYSVMSKNKCKVLTNDELRNHLFYMNLGDMFMDWKKYCIINYSTDLKGNPILDIPDQYMTKIYFSYKDNKMIVPIKKGGWHYFSLTFDDK